MIARWPWGNYWECPAETLTEPQMAESLTVYPPDDEAAEAALLGPDGEPLLYVPPHPVGFALPAPESAPAGAEETDTP